MTGGWRYDKVELHRADDGAFRPLMVVSLHKVFVTRLSLLDPILMLEAFSRLVEVLGRYSRLGRRDQDPLPNGCVHSVHLADSGKRNRRAAIFDCLGSVDDKRRPRLSNVEATHAWILHRC